MFLSSCVGLVLSSTSGKTILNKDIGGAGEVFEVTVNPGTDPGELVLVRYDSEKVCNGTTVCWYSGRDNMLQYGDHLL